MKLKNHWKRFWTLDRHHAEGFTLVELIVVIAILAILAGVGIPVYSGYITKANKGVDQTMVSDLVRSIELASILDPDAFPSDATIYLSTGNAKTTGTDAAKLDTILTNAYGSNFKSALKLKYSQWGLGETITTHVKQLTTALNGATLSYVDNVDELWTVVDGILTTLEKTETMDQVYGGSAGLMASAADYTMNGIAYADGADKQAEFAKMWADPSNTFTAYTNATYDPNDASQKNENDLNPMLARFAAIKARNYTLGNYLAGVGGISEAASVIQNANTGESAGGALIPDNALSVITGENWCKDVWGNNNQTQATALAAALNTYFGQTNYWSAYNTGNGYYAIQANGAFAVSATSQAYNDALGYYTLMNAVDDSASDTKNMSNEEYRETMADAVHNVGTLLQTPGLVDEVSGGCVAITVKKAQDGSISYYITPASIYAGGNDTVQSGVGQNTATLCDTVTVTVDGNQDTVSLSANSSFVLASGQSGTIKFALSDAYISTLPDGMTENDILEMLETYAEVSPSDPSAIQVNGLQISATSNGSITVDYFGYTCVISITVV